MTPLDLPADLSHVTPGVAPWPRVEFRGQVRPEASVRLLLEREFSYIFGYSRTDVEQVLVLRRFGSYSPLSDNKAVYGVELCLRNDVGYQTHIVKLGSEEEVGCDAKNWDACTRGRHVASRIFAPVWKVTFPDSPRVAVVYRDAYTLFGPGYGEDVAPRWLETIAHEAVFTNTVEPESVERTIAHLFTDLGLWFYPHAERDSPDAAAFYRRELVSEKKKKDALALWSSCPERLDLRRDALWLFCGRDKPDVDHAVHPARYLDPVELVGWALDSGQAPETLVGRAHGDLHGRNVLLGVRRNQAEYPAVFDYGGMGKFNVLAWDFAKLETELKVRLLQTLYRSDEAHKAIRAHAAWDWKHIPERTDATTHLAERLRFYFVFEEMLAERTEWINGRDVAEAWQPPGGRALTKAPEVDRLLALLLRIRQEAALALGFGFGRVNAWRDELYFALAVYGLVNARWETYTEPEWQSALLSAGVAAAHADFAQSAITEQCRAAAAPKGPHPSYRVPLTHAHRLWKAHQHPEGKALLDGQIQHYDHAVPLIAEHALFRCHAGDGNAVEKQLKELREKAKAFGDEETLARLGRAYKEMADESWERSDLLFDKLASHPAVQFYRLALGAYEDAYLLSGHYFPGVNVAALALLVGNGERAKEVAAKLRDGLAAAPMPSDEVYWTLATEGDAALILGDGAAALSFYGNALSALQKGEEGQAISSYRQLLRLRGPLGSERVEPILELFQKDETMGGVIREQAKQKITD